MHSDPQNRISKQPQRSKSYWAWIALAAALIVGVYFFSPGQAPEPEPAPAPPPAPVIAPKPQPELPPAPDIPAAAALAPAPAPTDVTEKVSKPAASLESSDEELRANLASDSASRLWVHALAHDNLIERSASIIDGLSRGAVPYKVLPVKPPAEKFTALHRGDKIYMDPKSYHRYDSYARAIGDLNTQILADNFKRFRPLLEQAYAGLGYPTKDLDNALIRSLDRILATPKIHEDIELKKKEAMYLYTDTQLEELPELQKLLLRMGPDNIALIQAQAQKLRSALLHTGP